MSDEQIEERIEANAEESATVPTTTSSSSEQAVEVHVPLKGYVAPPKPYKERRHPDDPQWFRDFYDDAIPSEPGFITDLVFHSRGYETPTLSVIWTALFILSSAIKREAWYKWTPKHLFTNQYIIIVGPAGVVKKTTAVTDIGYPILKKFRQYLKDAQFAEMKRIHIIQDKITPEAMIQSMLPENKDGTSFFLKDEKGEHIIVNGKAVQYAKTSEAALVISELSVMLSKSTYQSEMVQILLDLYDCRDEWHTETKGGGKKTLRNLHTSLFGATTVEGLRNSLPPSAKGDGFLSRTVLVHVPDTKRQYRRPFIPKYAPDVEELAKRLAWIAENTLGEYDLSPEADAYAEQWYQFFSKRKRDNPAFMAAWSRMDVNVYKTALLMRAQRYNCSDKVISLDDLKNAIRLLDLTYSSFPFLMSQISSDDMVVAVSTIEEWLRRRGTASRARLLSGTRIRSDIASWALTELVQRGMIEIKRNDNVVHDVSCNTNEMYIWLGGKHDGTGNAGEAGTDENINYTQSVYSDPPDGTGARREPHRPSKIFTEGANKKAKKKKRNDERTPKARKASQPGGVGKVDRTAPRRKAAPKRKGNSTANGAD